MAKRRSLVGPVVLVGLGALLLYSSLRSSWAPWEAIARYWPVLLIGWGLGKLWDHRQRRERADGATPERLTGAEVGMALALVVLAALAFLHNPAREATGHYRFAQTVEAQGAKTVHAEIEQGAGDLRVSGGAPELLQADVSYSRASQKPQVTYKVSDGNGELDVRQRSEGNIHFGGDQRNEWNLRFGDRVPLDLEIKVGAGTGRLDLRGVPLTGLRVECGAGTMYLDLSGQWKQGFNGQISGGVGTVTVRLPTSVGVRVHATGGLGTVSAPGFEREGDAYVNSAYGTSPVTLRLDIQGGIGTVRLENGS